MIKLTKAQADLMSDSVALLHVMLSLDGILDQVGDDIPEDVKSKLEELQVVVDNKVDDLSCTFEVE